MPELVRMNVEIQCADYLGVRRGCPEIGRIIDEENLSLLCDGLCKLVMYYNPQNNPQNT